MRAQVQVQKQMQKQTQMQTDADGHSTAQMLINGPDDYRQRFLPLLLQSSQKSRHQTVMPCMQIVFSNSKSGGWISMDPS